MLLVCGYLGDTEDTGHFCTSIDPQCLYLTYWQIMLAGSGQASLVQGYS